MSTQICDKDSVFELRSNLNPVIDCVLHVLVKLLPDKRVASDQLPLIELFLQALLYPQSWNMNEDIYLELNLVHEIHDFKDDWYSLNLTIDRQQFTIAEAGISCVGTEIMDSYYEPLWIADGNLELVSGSQESYVKQMMYKHQRNFQQVGESNVFDHIEEYLNRTQDLIH